MFKYKNKEQILQQIREIFLTYGDISADKYDSLKIPNKPARGTLRKFIGNWQTVRSIFIENTESNPYLAIQNKKLLNQLEKQRNINQVIIENCLASISKCSFKAEKIPPFEKAKNPQEFHAMKSDDHVGEKVESKWVQGVGEYNSELFIKRMKTYIHKIITFREQDKNSLGLNKLVVYMLGDHVTGELIYAGQAYQIDASLIDQFIMCLEIYTNMLLQLAKVFPEIELFCVSGNHGRHGKKGEGHPRSNFDYLLFRMLQKSLKEQKNIKIFASESPTMLLKNGNFNFAINHNEDVVRYMGIPYYGLDRKARRLDGLYRMIIDYKLGAHFHIPSNLGDETIINGTMVGGSNLSINKMQMSCRPSQKIFYFDPEHGIHRESNLYLEEPIKLKPDKYGIYTAHTLGEPIQLNLKGG